MKAVLTSIFRSSELKKSFLANTQIIFNEYAFVVDNTMIPDTQEAELLEDWEIGQYLGGN